MERWAENVGTWDPQRGALAAHVPDAPEWLRIAADAWLRASRKERVPGAPLRDAFARAWRAAFRDGGEKQAAADLAGATSEPAASLLAVLAVLASSVESDDDARTEAAQRAALVFAERALDLLPEDHSTGAAVRVARLRRELGDREGAARAWAAALWREPLIAWALPPAQWKGLPDPEAVALEEAEGPERDFRTAVRDLREPSRRGVALDKLTELLREPDAPWTVRLVHAAESLTHAMSIPPAEPARRDAALTAIETSVATLPSAHPVTAVLRALVAIARGRSDDAATEIARQIESSQGAPPSTESVRAVVDALTTELRRPPHDVRRILADAWLEASLDPLAALLEPASALAKLRSAMFALALTAAAAGVTSTAAAQDPVGGTPSEATAAMVETTATATATATETATATATATETATATATATETATATATVTATATDTPTTHRLDRPKSGWRWWRAGARR